jgi:hypothetical protein
LLTHDAGRVVAGEVVGQRLLQQRYVALQERGRDVAHGRADCELPFLVRHADAAEANRAPERRYHFAYMLTAATPPGFYLFAYGLSAVIAYLAWDRVQHDRHRAARGDHVVETSRDAVMPDHCVGCGIGHARIPLAFYARRVNISPAAAAFDPRFRKRYRFWFCPRCAKTVRRSWRIANGVAIGGAALIAATIVTTLILGNLHDFVLPGILGGGTLLLAGLIAKAFAGGSIVSVVDSGGDKVLFRFRNQVYRNHFAELNGEK